jgi:hypothetical protein
VNVWLALAHEIHPQHSAAAAWGESLNENVELIFCRFTQLGLLHLLTNQSAMGADVLTQAKAWAVYDAFIQTGATRLMDEPRGIDPLFRQQTYRNEASTKQWADGYLVAYSMAAGIKLVTFDRALAKQVKGAVLLS